MNGSTDSEGVPADNSASTPSSPAALDAKARREARKARILGAGNDRLARITKTGRGDEASELYASPSKPSGAAPSRPPAGGRLETDEDEVLRRANAAMRGSVGPRDDDDPQDVDISQGPDANPLMAMLAQQQGGAQGDPMAGMPPEMQGLMRALMGQEGDAGAAGQPGQAPPFPPFGAQQQQQVAEASAPSLLDAVFNILRVLVFVFFGIALAYGALTSGHAEAKQSVSESANADIVQSFEKMTKLHRWARLAYERPAHWEARYFNIESFGFSNAIHDVPVYWILLTLEIGLASMRIMLQRRRPQPPGFLLKAASFIPNAHIQLAIRALAAYLPLLDAFINDLAIVVFTIGCAVMFAAWKTGLDPLSAAYDGSVPVSAFATSFQQAAETAKEAIGSLAGDPPLDALQPPM